MALFLLATYLTVINISGMTHQLTLHCKIRDREAGLSLINLLTQRFTYHDGKSWLREINSGLVLINGRKADHGQTLTSGDQLTYRAVNHREPPVSTEIEVVFETPEFLLIGKPAGTPASRTGLIIQNTLVNILRRHYQQDIHLLHRLDRETSGLVLCARDKTACRIHQKNLKRIMPGKYYLAVVRGVVKRSVIEIDQPLAVREGSPIRCRMWCVEHGQPSRTIFYKIGTTENQSLLLAELITGRKHQIRAHLAHIGHPLIGDKIYDHEGKFYLKREDGELTEEDYQTLGAHNHTLHAWAVRIQLEDCPSKFYFSRIFSTEMKRYLKNFPNWEEKAVKVLQP